jgi:hypothetical protein
MDHSHAVRGDPNDLAQLAAHGIAPEEAERQLDLLARPAAWVTLERPCTAGDGIERLDAGRVEALLETHARAAAAGRVSAFVPASGAATRMFRELLAARELPGSLVPGDVWAQDTAVSEAVERFVQELPRFAFAGAISEVLAAQGLVLETLRRDGPWRPLLDALLAPSGLDAARSPKGLLLFHREHGATRTAFAEHLVEAVALAGDAAGVRRLDVTVSPEHRAGFARALAESARLLAGRQGGSYDVAFSEQHPATDTIAAAPGGGPFRDGNGRLLFRPAGHGALITNLAQSGRDLVFLKNIDNVAVDRLKPETARWARALVGLAAELAAGVHAWCARLDAGAPGARAGARAFAASELGVELPVAADAAQARAILDRPVRVCGMVANTGEPGGGPFWVRDATGVSRQIVEGAQVDHGSVSQLAILHHATHFNPVFLAASLRDAAGRPHDLARYVDESAVIVTRKSHAGRELLALERPGLWNGAMARWHTRFVEVPLAVFNPVKSVFDLLRPEHQGD